MYNHSEKDKLLPQGPHLSHLNAALTPNSRCKPRFPCIFTFLHFTMKPRMIFLLLWGPPQHLCIHFGIHTRAGWCPDLEMKERNEFYWTKLRGISKLHPLLLCSPFLFLLPLFLYLIALLCPVEQSWAGSHPGWQGWDQPRAGAKGTSAAATGSAGCWKWRENASKPFSLKAAAVSSFQPNLLALPGCILGRNNIPYLFLSTSRDKCTSPAGQVQGKCSSVWLRKERLQNKIKSLFPSVS